MTIIATDISDYRLGLAKQVGVDHVLNAHTDGADAIAAAILEITTAKGRCFVGDVRTPDCVAPCLSRRENGGPRHPVRYSNRPRHLRSRQ